MELAGTISNWEDGDADTVHIFTQLSHLVTSLLENTMPKSIVDHKFDKQAPKLKYNKEFEKLSSWISNSGQTISIFLIFTRAVAGREIIILNFFRCLC